MNRLQPLYERYRPQSFDAMVGNPKAIAQLKRIAGTGVGGRAVWISGPSATGKTTSARILAGTIADPKWATIEVDAGAVSPELVREWQDTRQYGWGDKGGRAYIVNEAHGLRAATIRAILVWLEQLPGHVCVIFTTTLAGESKLFDDQIDASPLLSRCLVVAFTNQGIAEPFAERARAIAIEAGLDGQPAAAYLKLAREHKGNMRAMLQAIEGGVMSGGSVCA